MCSASINFYNILNFDIRERQKKMEKYYRWGFLKEMVLNPIYLSEVMGQKYFVD